MVFAWCDGAGTEEGYVDGFGGWYCVRGSWRLRSFGEGWEGSSDVTVDGERFVHFVASVCSG